MHLTDKVVIVTGGADGIGLAAARAYASLGAHVLITGRRAERLEAIHANERRIHGLVADVGDPADAPRTVEKVLDLWGRIDVLVNNAGAGAPLPLADATAERLRSIYAVNTIGPTLLAAAVIPHLERSKGAIVNLSSSLARKAVPGFSDYAASKAALEHLTRCWAVELAPKGIRVNAIAAGPVETMFLEERMGYSAAEAEAIKLRERNLIPLGRRGVPEEVARWIIALTASEADWVTGQILGVDGGFALV
jgi:NAD(P)-dependent dehydrogenase (short-subunit alcohol dehydrogenase family)